MPPCLSINYSYTIEHWHRMWETKYSSNSFRITYLYFPITFLESRLPSARSSLKSMKYGGLQSLLLHCSMINCCHCYWSFQGSNTTSSKSGQSSHINIFIHSFTTRSRSTLWTREYSNLFSFLDPHRKFTRASLRSDLHHYLWYLDKKCFLTFKCYRLILTCRRKRYVE